jgi:hypothetical protein
MAHEKNGFTNSTLHKKRKERQRRKADTRPPGVSMLFSAKIWAPSLTLDSNSVSVSVPELHSVQQEQPEPKRRDNGVAAEGISVLER